MAKVVIGLSGGVDSSVAAAILKNDGYEVIGVSMRLWDSGENHTADARRVAEFLDIPFYEVDYRELFEEKVMDTFTKAYLEGKTPNPCIVCNRYLKFGAMLDWAEEFGADYIATGHYGIIDYDQASGRYILKRGDADAKDQSYVLYHLKQEQLKKILFPLGKFRDKADIRKMAEEMKIPTANKPDSQEICFIPDHDYARFIIDRCNIEPPEGNFIDTEGNILGRHKGILHYTVGQRKGLGIAFGKPMFVTKISAEDNTVMLGESGSEFKTTLYAEDLNFIPFDTPKEPFYAEAKVRYAAKPAPAKVSIEGDKMRVDFETPQRAITPGQAVVLYRDGVVLGGGTII